MPGEADVLFEKPLLHFGEVLGDDRPALVHVALQDCDGATIGRAAGTAARDSQRDAVAVFSARGG